MATFENTKLVREFFDPGASGRLSKSASLHELVSAVHTTYETPADQTTPAAFRVFLENTRGESDLSERELEILLLAARGHSNRQAAASLHLAEATIKRHLANIYAKIDVGSRGEASRKALSEGWISAHDLTRGG